MAVREQRLYIIGKPEIPQSKTSVFIDFEGDPERGLVYLIGALVCEQGNHRQLSFWADGDIVSHKRFFNQLAVTRFSPVD